MRGVPPDWAAPLVALGGTRSPTSEAFGVAAELARRFAERGATLVSGAVPGIDLATHLGARDLPTGVTVGVLANPVSLGLKGQEWHSAVVESEILITGALISEYNEAVAVWSDTFKERLLHRDRIISGISDVFVACECRENGATVDTARRAQLQGKLVFAVASPRRSVRVGVDQLVEEFGFPLFESAKMSARDIADAILEAVADLQSAGRPSHSTAEGCG